MVRIRLRRQGKKNRPFFRIVVADSRAPRDGAFIDSVGYYDPLPDPPVIVVDEAKVKEWLKRGAQPSEAAAKILARKGIIEYPRRKPREGRSEGVESSAGGKDERAG